MAADVGQGVAERGGAGARGGAGGASVRLLEGMGAPVEVNGSSELVLHMSSLGCRCNGAHESFPTHLLRLASCVPCSRDQHQLTVGASLVDTVRFALAM